jgi:hypothetical protein
MLEKAKLRHGKVGKFNHTARKLELVKKERIRSERVFRYVAASSLRD